MKIRVSAESAVRGVMIYSIRPDPPRSVRKKNGYPGQKAVQRLMALQSHIKRVSRALLEGDFVRLESWDLGIFLHVKVGTSTRKRFELRSLLGWIELCDF